LRPFLGLVGDEFVEFGRRKAIIRCGEPVRFQLSGFLARNRAESLTGGVNVLYKTGDLTNCAMMEMCR